MSEIKQNAQVIVERKQARIVPMVVFFGSLAVALLAVFALPSWAEASTLQHGVQHVLIFVAGAGAGSSLLTSLRNKREQ